MVNRRFKNPISAGKFYTVAKVKLASEAALINQNKIINLWHTSSTCDRAHRRSAHVELDEVPANTAFTEHYPFLTSLLLKFYITLSNAVKVIGMHGNLPQPLIKNKFQAFKNTETLFKYVIVKHQYFSLNLSLLFHTMITCLEKHDPGNESLLHLETGH